MVMLPIAEWMPDQPDLVTATDIASNVIPLTADSYGPQYQLAAYSSNALGAVGIGLFTCQNVDDAVYVFAGTQTDLFQLTSGALAWGNVSLASGGYTAGSTSTWRFVQFGKLVLATDFSDAIQTFTMGSSTNFAVLSAGAPQAKFIAVAKTFTIVGNTYDGVGGYNPARMWWSATNDPTNWPTPGGATAQQVQSDYSDLNGPQGDITGLVPNLTGCDCAIFFQRGITRMLYVGPPDIFDFFPVQNARGTRAPNSIVTLGALCFFWSDDGFYSFDGNTCAPIGANKVDRWFAANLNQFYLTNIIGYTDIKNRAIVWMFPSTQAPNGLPDTKLIYRWDIQRWSYSALINANGNIVGAQFGASGLTFGISMDAMYGLGFTNVDTLPYSLDNVAWIGGAPQPAFIDVNGYLAFDGPNTLEAQLGTQVVQLFPGKLGYVQSVRPLVDGGSPQPLVSVAGRQNYYDPEVFGPDVAVNIAGDCPQRSSGRYHRARITVPAGNSWGQGFGVEVTAVPAGQR